MNWLIRRARRITPRQGGAAIYGAVLYTEEHVHVRKMLNDPDYWDGLDAGSGPEWAVFAVQALPGTWGYPDIPPGSMGLMVPVWKEPAANRELLSDFGLSNSQELPLLLLFVENEDGAVEAACLSIAGGTVDETYASTLSGLKVVGDALRGMAGESRMDAALARRVVFQAVKDEQQWRRIKGGLGAWRKLIEHLP